MGPAKSILIFLCADGRDFDLSSTILTFVPEGPEKISFVVDLTDDDFFEGREDFTLVLQTDQSRVTLSPNSTVVSIVDNEGTHRHKK